MNVVTETRKDMPDAASSGQVLQRLSRLPVVTLRVDEAALERLAGLPGVVSVTEDRPVPPVLTESVSLIGGDRLREAGMTGVGSVVAVLDTGVAVNHPFLRGRVVAEACFSPSDPDYFASSLCPNGADQQEGPGSANAESGPCADAALDCDHGTHVAGIVAGNGQDLAGAPAAGVAPAAEIAAIQVFSKFESEDFCGPGVASCVLSFTSAQLAGLDKVLQLKEAGTPVVAANLSLGGGRYTAPCDGDPRKQAIDDLLAAGVATVVAAGNDGFGDAVNAPACVSSAVTVGSTTGQDEVSGFSNRGPLLDVFAPGTAIVSSVPGGGWAPLSGTSMAAPHVAGAFAVLRQAFPGKTVAELETAMKTTGKAIAYTGATTPRLQLDDAALGAGPGPEPTPPATFGNWTSYDIPDPGTAESSVQVDGVPGNASATLRVYVDVHHAWRGDLKIDLIAPGGRAYPLRVVNAQDGGDVIHETYQVNASSSVAAGVWKLRVQDVKGGNKGYIFGWSLMFSQFDNRTSYDIPDRGTVESPTVVDGISGNAPAVVMVYVDIHHTWRGDLKIDLIGPDGKVYPLRVPAPKDGEDIIHETYRVSTSASPANGTWRLRVEDVAAGDTGAIYGWMLAL
ncbi:S8 family serine peptidase [Planobispora longispora]|uniref:S8 family serine peptidase n=1 Tax=Planobispora longispora TaxID=28887 RepID=UPI001941A1F7|nr:S8 family serine peptidase [Planobispora longispora]